MTKGSRPGVWPFVTGFAPSVTGGYRQDAALAEQARRRDHERVRRIADLPAGTILSQAVPLGVAWLVIALTAQTGGSDPRWSTLALRLAQTGAILVPALLAHLAACHWRPWPAAMAWLAGFVAYPMILAAAGAGAMLGPYHWIIAAGCSLAFVLLHPGARQRGGRPANAVPPIMRWPITLDGTVATLAGLWALGATILFASTPDAVRNQPLRVWLNWPRIVAHPGEALWYLAQFTVLAAVLYGWYWSCRYLLVRRVLRQQGMIPFGFAVIAWIALATPLAASVGLALPLNIPEWTMIPSENHNPFDSDNYRFAIWLTAIAVPVVLSVERLLAEHTQASARHELVQAELNLLQQQINPHFLFNTLNTLYALCLRDRSEGADAILKLSDLLRYVVYHGPADRVPIDAEIEYLQNYLALQQLRFGHRCRLDTRWPEPGSGLGVPPLLLIMLLENAFKHGVEPSDGACEVHICATIAGRTLQFDCINTLPPVAPPARAGVGLVNLRRRLELILGEEYRLFAAEEQGRWRASLTVELVPC